MFSTEALKKGIEDIKKNIKVFEAQIVKERERIEEYLGMIDVLKKKETEQKIAGALEKSLNKA